MRVVRVRRWEEMKVKLVFKGVWEKSMEDMRFWWQVMKMKVQGLVFGSQLWRREGLGREFLKERSC